MDERWTEQELGKLAKSSTTLLGALNMLRGLASGNRHPVVECQHV